MKNNNEKNKISIEFEIKIIYKGETHTVKIKKVITPEQLPLIDKIIKDISNEIEKNIKKGIENISNIIEVIEQKNNVNISFN